MDNCYVFLCSVVNPEPKVDINCLVNGTIQERKSALTQWSENMKKFECLSRWIQYSLYCNPMSNHASINTHTF